MAPRRWHAAVTIVTVLTACSGGSKSTTRDHSLAGTPATTASPTVLAGHLAGFLGQPVPPALTWARTPGPHGDDYETTVPGVGTFDLDAVTQQVTLATFDRPEPTGTSRLTQDQARQTAITFLEDHNISFSGLADHRDTSLGVGGADPKFDFMWQAHDPSGAWLPTWVYVTVAADGPVAAFGRESDPLKISTTPTVTSTSATAKALASGGATASDPELTVETRADGTQLLVWVISVRSNGAAPSLRIVWVDAQTGEVTSP